VLIGRHGGPCQLEERGFERPLDRPQLRQGDTAHDQAPGDLASSGGIGRDHECLTIPRELLGAEDAR
jgi:hypothetical protein